MALDTTNVLNDYSKCCCFWCALMMCGRFRRQSYRLLSTMIEDGAARGDASRIRERPEEYAASSEQDRARHGWRVGYWSRDSIYIGSSRGAGDHS